MADWGALPGSVVALNVNCAVDAIGNAANVIHPIVLQFSFANFPILF